MKILLSLAVCCLLIAPKSFADGPAEDGFEPLFNNKDLTGWAKEGNAGFVAKDNMLVCTGAGNWPTWLRTTETFENFVLRLEYKGLYGAESGVFFHAPLHGRISHVGYEVQIGGGGGGRTHSTGAIFDAVAPLKRAPSQREDGFNELEIRMNWPKLLVRLNGEIVQDLDVEKTREPAISPASWLHRTARPWQASDVSQHPHPTAA